MIFKENKKSSDSKDDIDQNRIDIGIVLSIYCKANNKHTHTHP